MTSESIVQAARAYETNALDAEVRAGVLRRAADRDIDLDRIVRSVDLSLSYATGRYVARVRRSIDTLCVYGRGSSSDEAIRAALRALALECDKEARKARRMAEELYGELMGALAREQRMEVVA